MPNFAYKARRRSGEVVQGVLDVQDRAAALAQIERLGLFPVMVDASKAQVAAAEKAEKAKESGKSSSSGLPAIFRRRRQRKPKLQELATFTTQLANLLKCGMPLTVALQSMTHLETKGIPSDVSKTLKQEVMEGRSLSDAMSRQPVIFSDLYRNMVQAGEQSGALVEVLRRCGDNLTRANVMKLVANMDFEINTYIPGIRIKTSPTDFYPIEQVQMMKFTGEKWELFGPIIDGHAE